MWKRKSAITRHRHLNSGPLSHGGMKRIPRGEHLEPRMLMAADPIHIGLAYLETDYLETDSDAGNDSQPDRFILSFVGGAPGTELSELRIQTDKDNVGMSIGDLIFDTKDGGRGKEGFHDFKVVRTESVNGGQITASAQVEDGGTELIIRLAGFKAGDRLEFTLDVDQVLRLSPDLARFNSGLDTISTGQEFEDSKLSATFKAPHYEVANADSIFLNDYGNPASQFGLKLPPDNGTEVDSRPNRSAAAVATTTQVPKPISIAGTVWIDDNLNLRREATEGVLPGVEVSLWRKDISGRFVDTGFKQVTDRDGKYLFPTSLGLLPGEYQVNESQPRGFFSVGAVPGQVNSQTVGRATTDDVLSGIDIPLGDLHAVNYDFAEARPAQVSGFVYRDDNDNARRDTGEQGLAGVRVRLVPIDTITTQSPLETTTASDGSYSFSALSPGRYDIVEVTQPAELTDGRDTAGTVDGRAVGRADDPGDAIRGVDLPGGGRGVEYNFGELPLGSISGGVFLAAPGADCGTRHDGQSTPIAGASIELLGSNGIVIARTTTGLDGQYRFEKVPKGIYSIVEVTPAGLLDGLSHVGKIDGIAVGDSIGGGKIQDIRLPAGKAGVEYDFCEAAPGAISGFVYHDRSNDGRRDLGEEPIADARIELVNSSGTVVATSTTNRDGAYKFENVLPGTYSIREIQPTGFLDGLDSAGTVTGVAIGVASNPGDLINAVVLRQGQSGVDYNFGELRTATLAGRVHVDDDGDCVFDDGERPLEGVRIRVLDVSGREVANTTTDSQGRYRFEGLIPGVYTIIEEQPAGWFEGGATPGTAGGFAETPSRIGSITLTSGQVAVDYDFCERPPAEISGVVFVDRDADCLRDENEGPLSGVRVDLIDSTGRVIATTTTDATGTYRFTDLPEGNYTLRETQPLGYFHGGQTAGSGGGDASREDLISSIPIAFGERLTQYNFCEIEPSSIAGQVFIDNDDDCIPDADEGRIGDVAIQLYDGAGRLVATTRTNSSGQYRFDNLRPGEYTIVEIQPDGYFSGNAIPGSGGGRADGSDAITKITVQPGSTLVEYNFCELSPSSIAGQVFVDNDDDCVPDADEARIGGVVLQLYDRAGNLVATTRTNAAGQYQFDNLRPGEYRIVELQPDGFFTGNAIPGSGGGRADGSDAITEITIGPGSTLIEYNFCELLPGSISGQVWSETDLNRRRDQGDLPLAGVTVELLNEQGQSLSVLQTDSQGRYRFDGLRPGIYAVREIQPNGLFHGGQVAGSAGGTTSVDDLIGAIRLAAGVDAAEYNFPEFPPARISGNVFQDGAPITLSGPPQPASLRQYRDGVFTVDDKAIGGVVLELRNVLGKPFTADRALPGVYPSGPIRVVTAADGSYEFTGLRPGTYHVYQIQPTDFIDSLDTPGTTGGFAVNVGDFESNAQTLAFVQTLAASSETNPSSDAILNISLAAGGASRSNNFSEIVIVKPIDPVPPILSPPLPIKPPPAAIRGQFDDVAKVVGMGDIARLSPPMFADGEYEVTWHLSVINGGFPRGNGVNGVEARQVSAEKLGYEFIEGEHEGGHWTLVDRNGNPIDLGFEITLGADDATPLSGDFNGDGIDEVALFSSGQWFVDLNGNGKWDAGDLWIRMGNKLDRPVIGDWDGDGKDDIGIFGPKWQRDPDAIVRELGLPDPDNRRRRTAVEPVSNRKPILDKPRYLRRGSEGQLRADAIDHVFRYGEQPDTPLSGDWNGDGIDSIAVYRAGEWLLDADGDGRWTSTDKKIEFGEAGDEPIIGDWNGDGIDDLGVIRGDLWIIDSDGDRKLTGNDKQVRIEKPSEDAAPIVGDWDGDGKDELGWYDRAG